MTDYVRGMVYGCNNSQSTRCCSSSHLSHLGVALPLGAFVRVPFFGW